MKCSGCFREIVEGGRAYATATGSIGQELYNAKGDVGFYASGIEPWIAVLCEECGLAVHDFISHELQARHLGWK